MLAKIAMKTRACVPATALNVPPLVRSSKRPVNARLKAQHGMPSKSHRVSTPTKLASTAGGVLSVAKRPPHGAGL